MASTADAPFDSPSSPLSPDEAAITEPPTSDPSTPSSEPASPTPFTSATSPAAAAATTAFAGSPSSASNMSVSSQPLGNLNAARGKPSPRPAPTAYNPDILAKMKAFTISRQQTPTASHGGASPAGFPSNMKLPPQLNRGGSTPVDHSLVGSGPRPAPRGPSLAERRGGMKLPGGLPGSPQPAGSPVTAAMPAPRQKPKMTLTQMRAGQANGAPSGSGPAAPANQQTQMDLYKEFVDTKAGALTFKGKAVVHGQGIDFASGRSFNISLDEVDTLDELGKGNYGTVYKVRHSRPKFRRQGQGLAGNRARPGQEDESPSSPTRTDSNISQRGGTSGVVMAMKEMRLELDDAKFQTIIMELDVLHRCISPYIIDFYGAFFQEGAVYICMEFMDGSIDKLYGDGIPEEVLRRITVSTTLGLKSLKEEHNIIHRDVKPTNILVNTRGQVKICDFGVSGNLVASIAKTKIGCQSYMAPERISSGGAPGMAPGSGTYGVQSDIWSLGLTIIECAMGRYPYPPETYDNIFSQLSAIVDGDPPDLPASFSPAAHDFVAGCLNKIPNLRPTYPMLMQHAWLAPLAKPRTIVEEDEDEEAQAAAVAAAAAAAVAASNGAAIVEAPLPFIDPIVGEWVIAALDRRARGVMGEAAKPALHTAPLDVAGGSTVAEGGRPVAVGV